MLYSQSNMVFTGHLSVATSGQQTDEWPSVKFIGNDYVRVVCCFLL